MVMSKLCAMIALVTLTALLAPGAMIAPARAAEDKLTPNDGAAGDFLGSAVAISNTAVIGSIFGGSNSVYVFARHGGTWAQEQKLVASDGQAGDRFGVSVAVNGDTLVVGAPGDDGNRGSAYVFTRTNGIWTEQQKVTASDGLALDGFDFAAALSVDTFVVGATSDDGGRGPAYVFVRDGAVWIEQQKLTAGDRAPGDVFGQGVAIRGMTILVGSPAADVGSNDAQGAAYVFDRRGSAWPEEAKLTASDGTALDFFGFAVAIGPSGRFLIGAPGDEGNRGSAYVLRCSARGSEPRRNTSYHSRAE